MTRFYMNVKKYRDFSYFNERVTKRKFSRAPRFSSICLKRATRRRDQLACCDTVEIVRRTGLLNIDLFRAADLILDCVSLPHLYPSSFRSIVSFTNKIINLASCVAVSILSSHSDVLSIEIKIFLTFFNVFFLPIRMSFQFF